MTIGEYRKQLAEEIQKAASEEACDAGRAFFTVLHLIHDVDQKLPANFLTFGEIMRVGQVAESSLRKEWEEGRITGEECSMMYMKFYAHAEALKLQGKPIDLEIIGAQVRAHSF